ncbi:MAG: monovalent cation:proton antiporter-2 (CPA2) family protein [Gammaproteobacteria bacterium]
MHETELPYLRELLLFLALAGLIIPLLQRLRVNPVLGFLALGIAVGPYGLGSFADAHPALGWLVFARQEDVAVFAQFGVLFLMFSIGLEVTLERLWALRRWVFGAGSAQVLVCALIIYAIARAFGNPPQAATVLGLVLALSSTAVVMQLLAERRAIGSPLGQASLSVLMLQDLAVVPVLILIDALADRHGGVLSALGLTAAKSAFAIVAIILLGRRVIRPLFRAFAQAHRSDVFMALTLLAALAIAALTHAAGLSMALGAFLAGLLLAETEYRHHVEVTIEPFKGLLLGLFFISVGMGIDVREIVSDPGWLAASVLGLFAIKAGVIAAIFRAGGLSWGTAVEGGLLLGQGGEFAFIVVGYAMAQGLIDIPVGHFMMLVVGLSLMATPPIAHFAGTVRERIGARDARGGAAPPEPAGPIAGQVLIVGYGRVGQLLGQVLSSQDVPFIAIEADARRAAAFFAKGAPVYFGDEANSDLLRRLHVERAAAIVLTMDRPAPALRAAQAMRRDFPHVPLFARARDEAHARELKRAGATQVIPETLESSLQLAAFVLQNLGLPEAVATRVLELERDRRLSDLVSDPNRA